MQTRDNTWTALVASENFAVETKAVISGTDYTAISNPFISRALMPSALSVGNCVTSSLQLTVAATEPIARSAEIEIKKRLVDADGGGTTSGWLSAGTFFVAQRTRDIVNGTVSFVCYDAMLKANQVYKIDGLTEDDFPRAMSDVVNDIAAALGVQVDDRTVINTGEDYVIPTYVSESPMATVLADIAAVHGGNFMITSDNKLRLVPLIDASNASTSADAVHTRGVLGSVALSAPLTVTGVHMTRTDGTEFSAGDTTGFVLDIINDYSTQGICDALCADYYGLLYVPYAIVGGVYDPAAELGDYIINGENIQSVIYAEEATLSTIPRFNASCIDFADAEDEYPYAPGTAIELNNVKKVVSGLNAYFFHDTQGAHIASHPNDATRDQNVLITTGGLQVRDGENVVAEFGPTSSINLLEFRKNENVVAEFSGRKMAIYSRYKVTEEQVTYNVQETVNISPDSQGIACSLEYVERDFSMNTKLGAQSLRMTGSDDANPLIFERLRTDGTVLSHLLLGQQVNLRAPKVVITDPNNSDSELNVKGDVLASARLWAGSGAANQLVFGGGANYAWIDNRNSAGTMQNNIILYPTYTTINKALHNRGTKMIYEKGDAITMATSALSYSLGGFLTSSGAIVYMTYPLNKPLASDVTGVTCAGIKARVRQGGKYILGSGSAGGEAAPSAISAALTANRDAVHITMTIPAATASNNDAVGIQLSAGTLTFK